MSTSHPLSSLPDEFVEDAVDRTMLVLSSRTRRRVLYYVMRYPGSSVSDVADGLCVSKSMVHFHIEKLGHAGFLLEQSPERRGRKGRYGRRTMKRRVKVSSYGERWLQLLYDDPDMVSSPFPGEGSDRAIGQPGQSKI